MPFPLFSPVIAIAVTGESPTKTFLHANASVPCTELSVPQILTCLSRPAVAKLDPSPGSHAASSIILAWPFRFASLSL